MSHFDYFLLPLLFFSSADPSQVLEALDEAIMPKPGYLVANDIEVFYCAPHSLYWSREAECDLPRQRTISPLVHHNYALQIPIVFRPKPMIAIELLHEIPQVCLNNQ
jgi:hypothetical protein